MVSFVNDAETGTDGAAVTTANSGLAGVTVDGTGPTLTFSSAQEARGALSYLLSVPTSGHAYFTPGTLASANPCRCRFYIYLTANPSSTVQFVQTVTSGAALCYVYLTNTGKLVLVNSAGTQVTTSAASVPLNTWIRIEVAYRIGTTTTNGAMDCAMYYADDTTPIDRITNTAMNTGTSGTFTRFNIGKNNSAGTFNAYIDTVAVDDGGFSFIGPAALPGPQLRAAYNSGAQSNAIPLNVPGVVVKKDDVVVVVALTSDYLRRINAAPTGLTGVQFVEEGGVYGQVNYANAYSWTAKATQDETVTIQAVPSGGNAGADYVIMRVYVFSNAEGAGDTIVGGGWASAKGSATVPSLTQTNVADHSVIIFAAVDWNARSATGATFTSTGAGAPTTDYAVSTSAAGYYAAEYLDAGLAGAKTVGMSAPASQKWSAISIEVVGKGLGPQVPRVTTFMEMDALSDFEVVDAPVSTEDILVASATAGVSFGGAFIQSAVMAARATPTLTAAAVRQQLATLAVRGTPTFAPQSSPQAALAAAGVGGLVVAGQGAVSAVVAARGTPALAVAAVRQQLAVLPLAGLSGAAIGNVRGLLGTLVVAGAGAMAPNTGASAVVAMRGTPGLAIPTQQFAFLRVLAVRGTPAFAILAKLIPDYHPSGRVVALVLDSGGRLVALDAAAVAATVLPGAGALAVLR